MSKKKHEEKKMPKMHGKMAHKRAKGGKMGGSEFVETGEGAKDADFEKAAHEAVKSGGKVSGKKGAMRPDRRARGGATSDANPTTTAGKMSTMPFEAKQSPKDDHGEGKDSD